ncbi:MAG: hypothetical protein IKN63_02835 [Bacilli bacterium]|nr:hypothetical protein [Bacilli bacterium]
MCSEELQVVMNIVIQVLDVVHFFVPIVLIIFCTIDIFKIIVSKKEDEVKKLRNDVFWKIFYAIMVYLIPYIVPFVLGAADKILPMDYDNSWQECYNYVKKNPKSY